MVQTKRRRKVETDFKRRKGKVGGKKLAPENVTRTDFRVKSLQVRQQGKVTASAAAAAAAAAAGAGYSSDSSSSGSEHTGSPDAVPLSAVPKLQAQAKHHNSSVRKAALRGLATFAAHAPSQQVAPLLQSLLASACAAWIDEYAVVRRAGACLFHELTQSTDSAVLQPFLPLVWTYMKSALSDLSPNTRLDALVPLWSALACVAAAPSADLAAVCRDMTQVLVPMLRAEEATLVAKSCAVHIAPGMLGIGAGGRTKSDSLADGMQPDVNRLKAKAPLTSLETRLTVAYLLLRLLRIAQASEQSERQEGQGTAALPACSAAHALRAGAKRLRSTTAAAAAAATSAHAQGDVSADVEPRAAEVQAGDLGMDRAQRCVISQAMTEAGLEGTLRVLLEVVHAQDAAGVPSLARAALLLQLVAALLCECHAAQRPEPRAAFACPGLWDAAAAGVEHAVFGVGVLNETLKLRRSSAGQPAPEALQDAPCLAKLTVHPARARVQEFMCTSIMPLWPRQHATLVTSAVDAGGAPLPSAGHGSHKAPAPGTDAVVAPVALPSQNDSDDFDGSSDVELASRAEQSAAGSERVADVAVASFNQAALDVLLRVSPSPGARDAAVLEQDTAPASYLQWDEAAAARYVMQLQPHQPVPARRQYAPSVAARVGELRAAAKARAAAISAWCTRARSKQARVWQTRYGWVGPVLAWLAEQEVAPAAPAVRAMRYVPPVGAARVMRAIAAMLPHAAGAESTRLLRAFALQLGNALQPGSRLSVRALQGSLSALRTVWRAAVRETLDKVALPTLVECASVVVGAAPLALYTLAAQPCLPGTAEHAAGVELAELVMELHRYDARVVEQLPAEHAASAALPWAEAIPKLAALLPSLTKCTAASPAPMITVQTGTPGPWELALTDLGQQLRAARLPNLPSRAQDMVWYLIAAAPRLTPQLWRGISCCASQGAALPSALGFLAMPFAARVPDAAQAGAFVDAALSAVAGTVVRRSGQAELAVDPSVWTAQRAGLTWPRHWPSLLYAAGRALHSSSAMLARSQSGAVDALVTCALLYSQAAARGPAHVACAPAMQAWLELQAQASLARVLVDAREEGWLRELPDCSGASMSQLVRMAARLPACASTAASQAPAAQHWTPEDVAASATTLLPWFSSAKDVRALVRAVLTAWPSLRAAALRAMASAPAQQCVELTQLVTLSEWLYDGELVGWWTSKRLAAARAVAQHALASGHADAAAQATAQAIITTVDAMG